MRRYEIQGDPISIAYGFDIPIPGVFLSVADRRLKYDADASKEVNAVTSKIGVFDGGGSYFDLHTGNHGSGIKVDDKTMATYLKRFGVPEDMIAKLPLHILKTDVWACCKARGNLTCSKCHSAKYCSKKCQANDWAIHKMFCKLELDSALAGSEGSLSVYVLPQNTTAPLYIRLPCWFNTDEDYGGFWDFDVSSVISEIKSTVRSDHFPGNDPHAPASYHVIFKDDFLVDNVSKPNQCIRTIFEKLLPGEHPHWKGSVILAKAEPLPRRDPKFEDITPDDVRSALSFLCAYSRAVR